MPFPGNERFATVRVARLWLWPLAGTFALVVAFMVVTSRADVPFVPVAYAAYGFLFLAALRSLHQAGMGAGDVFGAPPEAVKSWPLVIVLVPVMFSFAAMTLWATAFVASWVFPEFGRYLLREQNDPGPLRALNQAGSTWLILFIVVVGPVVEEIVFRGLVLRRWIARRSLWRGVVGSSLVFALLHPPFWIGAFVIGIFLSLLYLVTRSLYAPIAFHAMYNGLITFTVLGANAARLPQEEMTLEVFRRNWIGQTALLLVSGWIVFAVIRRLATVAQRNASDVSPNADDPTP